METDGDRITKWDISNFLGKVVRDSDFSRVSEIEDFERCMTGLTRKEDRARLCQRALEVFEKLTRPIPLDDLFTWTSTFLYDSEVTVVAGKELLKALSEELPKIDDARKILKWQSDLKGTFLNAADKLLEKRLLYLFSQISSNNISEWLSDILAGKKICSYDNVRSLFSDSCTKSKRVGSKSASRRIKKAPVN